MLQTFTNFHPTMLDPRGVHLPERQDWLLLPMTRANGGNWIDESNFVITLARLGGESDDVEVHRFKHWTCGWFEIILVRPETAAATTADQLVEQMERYPLLDEDDYTKRVHDAYVTAWDQFGRVQFINSLTRRLELPDDLVNALHERSDLRIFFQGLNAAGDYEDDGHPNIEGSIQEATLEAVRDFLATPERDPRTPDLLAATTAQGAIA